MTLTSQQPIATAATEQAIADKLAQLQTQVKQLNSDYELRPIHTYSRRWDKQVLFSYSVWRKSMPGVKQFKLSEFGSAKKPLIRQMKALEAVEQWIEERKNRPPEPEIDRSQYPTLPSVVPFAYDDTARRLGEIIAKELRLGDVIRTPYCELPPLTVISQPERTGDIVAFRAVREGEQPLECSFNWRWRFKLIRRENAIAAA